MPKPIDLSTQRFGRLVVAELLPDRRGKDRIWKCRCDCGGSADVSVRNLQSGNTRSCGCLQKEGAAEAGRKQLTRHGKSSTGTFNSWHMMGQRCENPHHIHYRSYGGRGITVCERTDNNGNYEPGNCTWATKAQQSSNTRSTRWLEHAGKRMTLTQWAESVGMSPGRLHARLAAGMSIADALSTPVKKRSRRRK